MPKQPVILQILPELVSGGVERGTVEIARALNQQGWGNIVVSAGGPMESALAHTGATHIKLPVDSKKPLQIYRNIAALEKVIRKHKVNIVHARSRAPAWSAYFAAKRTGATFMTTFHGFYGTHGMFKKHYNSVMVRGTKVIAISEFIRDHILRNYPACPAQRIEVIHRGADLAAFHPDAVTPGILGQLSDEWRLTEQHVPVILLPGRITRWKGQDVFIRALSKIRDRQFIALLVGEVGGHSGYRQEIEELIRQKGLQSHVRFVGKTSHMTEAYALSDIVVVPSTAPEAFGRVPVEAQAMGKLVIAADHGGVQETVIHGETGFLVPPGDITALAQMILNALMMPPEARQQIGVAARQHVSEHFSIETMQHKTLSLYASLL